MATKCARYLPLVSSLCPKIASFGLRYLSKEMGLKLRVWPKDLSHVSGYLFVLHSCVNLIIPCFPLLLCESFVCVRVIVCECTQSREFWSNGDYLTGKFQVCPPLAKSLNPRMPYSSLTKVHNRTEEDPRTINTQV